MHYGRTPKWVLAEYSLSSGPTRSHSLQLRRREWQEKLQHCVPLPLINRSTPRRINSRLWRSFAENSVDESDARFETADLLRRVLLGLARREGRTSTPDWVDPRRRLNGRTVTDVSAVPTRPRVRRRPRAAAPVDSGCTGRLDCRRKSQRRVIAKIPYFQRILFQRDAASLLNAVEPCGTLGFSHLQNHLQHRIALEASLRWIRIE